MERWLVEAWLRGESTPFMSVQISDIKTIGLQVQIAFDSGADNVVVTHMVMDSTDTGTMFPNIWRR